MTIDQCATKHPNRTQPLVLVVDDDLAIRMQIRFSLENEGFQVAEAESGRQAIDVIPELLPDLILLDVIMPDLDGFTTCRNLRQQPGSRHTPIVMVTGLEDPETITQAFDAGATDFISKPLNLLILGYRARYWIRSGEILNAFNTNQQRLYKAQDIACLAHWELDLDDHSFQLTCNSPEKLGLTPTSTYESLFAGIEDTKQPQIVKQLQEAYQQNVPFSVHYQRTLSDGSKKDFLNQGEVLVDPYTGHRRAVGIIQDISGVKRAEEKIRYLAFYDNLTGLANRMLFREHWTHVKALAERGNRKVVVFFIDLDHFKRINDSLGHPAGDKVLVTVAERIKTTMRQCDVISRPGEEDSNTLISRLGGDEFTILATNFVTANQLAGISERLIQEICKPIALESTTVNLTASVGISVYPEDGSDIDTLLRHADTAMYEAKELGRNNYQFFQQRMNDDARERFLLSNRLHRALNDGDFQLYYQPQYANSTQKMTGVEALIRWIDPDKGMIRPDRFLPFAEENGFIDEINDWVIREACRQAGEWVSAGLFTDCRMGINISGKRLDFKRLTRNIEDALTNSNLPPHYLEIELTERVMMTDTESAREMIVNLRNLGISIAIDDFGTGYSALSHLQFFPLDTLKIDKSFIHNLQTAKNSLALLQSIIGIAKSFELKVVAEGVETEAQLATLAGIGCDDLQGYLLGRPIPAKDLTSHLELQRR